MKKLFQSFISFISVPLLLCIFRFPSWRSYQYFVILRSSPLAFHSSMCKRYRRHCKNQLPDARHCSILRIRLFSALIRRSRASSDIHNRGFQKQRRRVPAATYLQRVGGPLAHSHKYDNTSSGRVTRLISLVIHQRNRFSCQRISLPTLLLWLFRVVMEI